MIRVFHQLTVLIYKTVVNTPGINTDALDAYIIVYCFSDRSLDLVKNSQNVPSEGAVNKNRLVGETVVLFKVKFFAIKAAYYASTAGSTKVNGEHF